METSKKCCRSWLGGTLCGIGISAILAAALEQFTRYNLFNFTTLAMALGLIAIVLGFVIARAGRGRSQAEHP